MSRASSLIPGHQPDGFDDPMSERAFGNKQSLRTAGGLALMFAAILSVLGLAYWAAHAPTTMGSGSRNTPYAADKTGGSP